MIKIILNTERFSPYRHEIGISTSLDWNQIIKATYQDRSWIVELDEAVYLNGFEFKFRINGEWQLYDNLYIIAQDNKDYIYTDKDVPLARIEARGPLPDRSRLQKQYFEVDMAGFVPEVIVIGSGMAGGTLAERLSDMGVKTLVLEAGGLLFPTHTANLPRRQKIGEFDKHLWQLWPDFRALPFNQNNYNGGQAFNLGGKSVFWGGFIPRLSSWELDFWPQKLKWDLEDSYYDKAEALMGKSFSPNTLYSNSVHNVLFDLLPDYIHKEAPMAIRNRNEGSNMIATGLFSTADLIMESILSPGPFGKDNLKVLLNHDVIKIIPGDNEVTVEVHDILNDKLLQYKAPKVVLAAGTIESSKIAHQSKLPSTEIIGKGITDHPVYFTHFKIGPNSPYYEPYGNVKVLSQPKEGNSPDRDPFNILLELGADFNHGRYLDEAILKDHFQKRDFSMLCEIVFLCNQELIEDNNITYPLGKGQENINMAEPTLPYNVMQRIWNLRDQIIGSLGGDKAIHGKFSEGFGGLGGAGHETGTLRMAVNESGRISKGQKAPSKGFVNDYGKWTGCEGLYVCDLSIFPTSPAANPSLTLVALALRLADHLKNTL